jgi:hypothetical protein
MQVDPRSTRGLPRCVSTLDTRALPELKHDESLTEFAFILNLRRSSEAQRVKSVHHFLLDFLEANPIKNGDEFLRKLMSVEPSIARRAGPGFSFTFLARTV